MASRYHSSSCPGWSNPALTSRFSATRRSSGPRAERPMCCWPRPDRSSGCTAWHLASRLRHNKLMNQPNQTIRYVAMAVTVVARLAISIPFVWQHSVEAEPGIAAGLAVAPVASHDSAAEAPGKDAACAADAKPANMDFKFKDLDGKEVPLSSYKGKVVLLNFWATWCGPCKAEIPGFVELQAKYKDKLT